MQNCHPRSPNLRGVKKNESPYTHHSAGMGKELSLRLKTKPTPAPAHHKWLVVAAVESRLPLQRDGVVGGGDELEDPRAVGPARLEHDEVVAVGAQAVVHDAPVKQEGKTLYGCQINH